MPSVTRLDPPRVPTAAPVTAPAVRRPAHTRRTDLAVVLLAVTGAVWVTGRLWLDPATQGIAANGADQAQGEWLLRLIADSLIHGHNPLYTHSINAPTGVNLADNTAATLLGTLLAPITLAFGAPVAFVAGITANLAATAYAWYHFLSRHVTRTAGAAVLGGLLCGFGPGIVAHANGHLNFTAQWLVPVLLWRLAVLARAGARRRDAVIVGLLVAAQYSLGAELLFITAVALAVFVTAWFVALDARRRRYVARRVAPRAARRLGLAALVSAAVLAYPVWMQYLGPHAYRGSAFHSLGVWENTAAYVAYPTGSLAGALGFGTDLAINRGEENSFLGPVLAAFAIGAAWWFARRRRRDRGTLTPEVGRALAATAAVAALIALGPRLTVGGWHSSIPLPWHALQYVPIFRDALPGRFALAVVPIIAIWLAAAVDAVTARRRGPTAVSRRVRVIAAIVAVAALVPLLPAPIATAPRAALPTFITSGDWRRYQRPGTTVVTVPPTRWDNWDGQRWQAATGFAFDIEGGYILAPGATGRGTPNYVVAPTAALLSEVALTGVVPPIGPVERGQARRDATWWHAGLVVLPDATPGLGHEWAAHHDALLIAAGKLFGRPTRVDDVWLWTLPG